MPGSHPQASVTEKLSHLNFVGERPVCPGDLNRSMQHLHSSTREGGVENEAATQDLVQLRTKKPDVGYDPHREGAHD